MRTIWLGSETKVLREDEMLRGDVLSMVMMSRDERENVEKKK